MSQSRPYNMPYSGKQLDRIAFPLGGIGAGMICIEGAGALSHVSVRNRPEVFNEPLMFSALCVKGTDGNVARVLEGPVPSWKLFGPPGTGNGGKGTSHGLPRFAEAEFLPSFPFAMLRLEDPHGVLDVEIYAWSPFIPGDADNSSLSVAALEYHFVNLGPEPIEAVYSFHAANFMSTRSPGAAVLAVEGGFVLSQPGSDEAPQDQGAFCAALDDPGAKVNCAWFRGGWFDPLTVVWKSISEGRVVEQGPIAEGDPSSGGSIYVPVKLAVGESKTIRLRLCWYVPRTDIRYGEDSSCCEAGKQGGPKETHVPWYAGRYGDIHAVNHYWRENYDDLRAESKRFSDCFYDTSLPPEAVEAVAANLTILKSPTVLRQTDGRLWCWEGCRDSRGCCPGSCTHVWNYAQALPHLFPGLERSLRRTEFGESQDDCGRQAFRSALPIRPDALDPRAAADGQLGGIMKVYREWRISGDTEWMKQLWTKVSQSLEYCIATWDPDRVGALSEPHHNTYDIEFWGPDGMCTSFYLGALAAAVAMGKALDEGVAHYEELLEKGRQYLETELFDGEYFYQDVRWKDLHAAPPGSPGSGGKYSSEALKLAEKEGPKYQYGTGCLSDGVLGAWMGAVCGLTEFVDVDKVASHLGAVHKHNFRADLSEHANPQRPTYAAGKEAGLLLCSWPKGGEPTLPFVYSNEVWTGIEYQVASHLMMTGQVEKGLQIVRAVRDRYDGSVRNPFNEYECGHWYARAMSSYALIQGLTGIRYDAVAKTLYVRPKIDGDFRSFLSTATGYGTAGVADGKPFVEVVSGQIDVERMEYEPK